MYGEKVHQKQTLLDESTNTAPSESKLFFILSSLVQNLILQ